jgi:hypothetical protein
VEELELLIAAALPSRRGKSIYAEYLAVPPVRGRHPKVRPCFRAGHAALQKEPTRQVKLGQNAVVACSTAD